MHTMKTGADIMILTIPDPKLREVSQPVTEDDNIEELVTTMLNLMIEAGGVGLAAIQTGVAKRLIVLGCEPHLMINPVITKMSTKQVLMQEGCLSIPGMYGEVKRPEKITVEFIGADGEEHVLKADDTLSRIIQHEVDHLDGVLFIDRMEAAGNG